MQKETAYYFEQETHFANLFSTDVQAMNMEHFTPLEVAKKAAHFLATEKNQSILDVGSGSGKFCLTAAFHYPNCRFFGVEQRENLHLEAEKVKAQLLLLNVEFINTNIDHIQFEQYDNFYFFNSFHEQLDDANKLDSNILHDVTLYHYYNRYFFKQLKQMKSGTKLACFFTLEEEIPDSYFIVEEHFEGKLKCYVKI
jgi:cyclopropane fatty-acyl-phospholipid synthase-like methyltransferase